MTNYQDYGFETENAEHTHSYLYHPIKELLTEKKDQLILDVGCGNGWLSNALIGEGFNVYGIDASVSGIEIANKSNPGRFFIHDVNQDELPTELHNISFDVIISTEVIEHLYSPKRYLDFCHKILLEKKGEIILSTPYHGYLKNLALAVTGKMDQHFTVLWEGGHIKFWSRNTLEKALKNSSFHPTKFVGCGRLPFFWKSMIINAVVE